MILNKDYQKQEVTPRSKSIDKSMDLNNDFLTTWDVEMAGRRSFYLRDNEVPCLLVNYSRKGTHSFSYDYRKGKVHKSKVFGYFPSMTVEKARLRAIEINKECIQGDKNYDDLFEIHRLPSYLYFLMTDNGEIKIGHSTDVWNRVNSLVATQQGVVLLGLRKESKYINEAKLHYIYRAFRIKGGEYFKKNAYLLELISRFCIYRESDVQVSRLMGQHNEQIYQ